MSPNDLPSVQGADERDFGHKTDWQRDCVSTMHVTSARTWQSAQPSDTFPSTSMARRTDQDTIYIPKAVNARNSSSAYHPQMRPSFFSPLPTPPLFPDPSTHADTSGDYVGEGHFSAPQDNPLSISHLGGLTPRGQHLFFARANYRQAAKSRLVLPKVPLYEEQKPSEILYTDDEDYDDDWECQCSGEKYPKENTDIDTPYMPGSLAENKKRCLTWLRSIHPSAASNREEKRSPCGRSGGETERS